MTSETTPSAIERSPMNRNWPSLISISLRNVSRQARGAAKGWSSDATSAIDCGRSSATLAIICAIARPKWLSRAEIGHSIVAGILVHGFYLGGTAVAISLSIPAGLSALIPGLQPILTSTIANRWLGERVTAMQWGGLLIGLAGVALILHDRPMGGQAGWGWIASAISLVSITLGTLYQRRYCSRIDWRSGNLVQYVAVTVFFAIGAFLFEARVVHWTTEFILALVWLAVVLSIGALFAALHLVRAAV